MVFKTWAMKNLCHLYTIGRYTLDLARAGCGNDGDHLGVGRRYGVLRPQGMKNDGTLFFSHALYLLCNLQGTVVIVITHNFVILLEHVFFPGFVWNSPSTFALNHQIVRATLQLEKTVLTPVCSPTVASNPIL